MAKKFYSLSVVQAVVFCLFTFLLTIVDVGAVGPQESFVGFSSFNLACSKNLPYSSFCYMVSEVLGYIALALIFFYAIIGVFQLVKTRSIKGVEPEIICLGIVFVLTAFFYVLFDKAIVINMRPVLENGRLEPSYPSSHTLLSVVVFMCSYVYLSNKNKTGYKIICAVLMFLTVIFRLISGVHWVTDIFGGILLSSALVFLFKALLLSCDGKNKGKEK